jgi:hypothetical protein
MTQLWSSYYQQLGMIALPSNLKRKNRPVVSPLPDSRIRLVITDSRSGQALPTRYIARRRELDYV